MKVKKIYYDHSIYRENPKNRSMSKFLLKMARFMQVKNFKLQLPLNEEAMNDIKKLEFQKTAYKSSFMHMINLIKILPPSI